MRSDDLTIAQLDDEVDRDELRQRYYGLMQELRVLLPGVQILVAFLLTVPFATRFGNVGRFEKSCFAVALGGGVVAIILFVTPTAIHRVGERRARSRRLIWSVRLTRSGIACFGIALTAAVMLVTSKVFGTPAAWGCGAASLVLIISLWVALPLGVTAHEPALEPERRSVRP
jgi:Family of unknown function (DUF6328)